MCRHLGNIGIIMFALLLCAFLQDSAAVDLKDSGNHQLIQKHIDGNNHTIRFKCSNSVKDHKKCNSQSVGNCLCAWDCVTNETLVVTDPVSINGIDICVAPFTDLIGDNTCKDGEPPISKECNETAKVCSCMHPATRPSPPSMSSKRTTPMPSTPSQSSVSTTSTTMTNTTAIAPLPKPFLCFDLMKWYKTPWDIFTIVKMIVVYFTEYILIGFLLPLLMA